MYITMIFILFSEFLFHFAFFYIYNKHQTIENFTSKAYLYVVDYIEIKINTIKTENYVQKEKSFIN